MNMTQTNASEVDNAIALYKAYNGGEIKLKFDMAFACLAAYILSHYPQDSELYAHADLVRNNVASNSDDVAWIVNMHQLFDDLRLDKPNTRLAISNT